MKYSWSVFGVVLILFVSVLAKAKNYEVNSKQGFESAHASAADFDTITWESGTFGNIDISIKKNNLTIMAEQLGQTIFSGASKVVIFGDNVKFIGFQYIDGNIGTDDVVTIKGNNNYLAQLNISGYTSYKYLMIRPETQYNTVAYCNFENRINLDDQNILSIRVSDVQPGYHVIQYCTFQNFQGIGKDMGIEPIRIGVSKTSMYNSRSIVEYCYFTQCSGDGEIVSVKSGQNVIRYNTFEDNPLSELVLRHGNESVVYGNFFLNGRGGVRIKEGNNHVIFNNYFYGLTQSAFYLKNSKVSKNPVDSILIAFNTVVECKSSSLGKAGDIYPTNVTLANNLFFYQTSTVLREPSGMETWVGNLYSGKLGVEPSSGLSSADVRLKVNEEGYYQLDKKSAAIDAAKPGYTMISSIEGITIDNNILTDVNQNVRPDDISRKDVGGVEYSDNQLKPMATLDNVGPSYLR